MYRSRRVFVLLGVGSISVLLSFQVCHNVFAQSEPEKDLTASVQNAGKPQPGADAMKDRIIGDFHMGRGEYDDAIAAYRKGLKADPSNSEIRYKLNRAIDTCKKENAALNKGLSCGAGGSVVPPMGGSGQDRIAGIIVRGNVRIPAPTFRKSISIFPGDIYDPAKIDRDVAALKKTGYFDDVRVETSDDPTGERGGTVVTFYVHEKDDASAK